MATCSQTTVLLLCLIVSAEPLSLPLPVPALPTGPAVPGSSFVVAGAVAPSIPALASAPAAAPAAPTVVAGAVAPSIPALASAPAPAAPTVVALQSSPDAAPQSSPESALPTLPRSSIVKTASYFKPIEDGYENILYGFGDKAEYDLSSEAKCKDKCLDYSDDLDCAMAIFCESEKTKSSSDNAAASSPGIGGIPMTIKTPQRQRSSKNYHCYLFTPSESKDETTNYESSWGENCKYMPVNPKCSLTVDDAGWKKYMGVIMSAEHELIQKYECSSGYTRTGKSLNEVICTADGIITKTGGCDPTEDNSVSAGSPAPAVISPLPQLPNAASNIGSLFAGIAIRPTENPDTEGTGEGENTATDVTGGNVGDTVDTGEVEDTGTDVNGENVGDTVDTGEGGDSGTDVTGGNEGDTVDTGEGGDTGTDVTGGNVGDTVDTGESGDSGTDVIGGNEGDTVDTGEGGDTGTDVTGGNEGDTVDTGEGGDTGTDVTGGNVGDTVDTGEGENTETEVTGGNVGDTVDTGESGDSGTDVIGGNEGDTVDTGEGGDTGTDVTGGNEGDTVDTGEGGDSGTDVTGGNVGDTVDTGESGDSGTDVTGGNVGDTVDTGEGGDTGTDVTGGNVGDTVDTGEGGDSGTDVTGGNVGDTVDTGEGGDTGTDVTGGNEGDTVDTGEGGDTGTDVTGGNEGDTVDTGEGGDSGTDVTGGNVGDTVDTREGEDTGTDVNGGNEGDTVDTGEGGDSGTDVTGGNVGDTIDTGEGGDTGTDVIGGNEGDTVDTGEGGDTGMDVTGGNVGDTVDTGEGGDTGTDVTGGNVGDTVGTVEGGDTESIACGDNEVIVDGQCQCDMGYQTSWGICTDVDECQQHVCEQFEECNNTPGTYSCDCMEGFKKIENNECHPIDCPDDFTYDSEGNVCFKVFIEPKSMELSKQTCQGFSEGRLAVLNSRQKLDAVGGHLDDDSKIWVDARQSGKHTATVFDYNFGTRETSFEEISWGDGSRVSTELFATQPTSWSKECTVMSTTTNNMLEEYSCQQSMPFVCEVPIKECPSTYIYDKEAHFCFKFFPEKTTQYIASEMCENEGSRLAITNTDAKIDLVKQEMFKAWYHEGVFVGGEQLRSSVEQKEYEYYCWWFCWYPTVYTFTYYIDIEYNYWDDHSHIDSSLFDPQEPNDPYLETCVEISADLGHELNDIPCNNYLAYACEIPQ